MADFLKLIPLATAAVLLGAPLMAQDTTPATDENAGSEQAASPELPLGQEVAPADAIGQFYANGQYGDWTLRCLRTESGNDPCQIYQLLKDGDGNSVAEVSLFRLPEGQPAVAGATIGTPLDTLLTQQVTISVDGTNAKRYPFTYCNQQGCFAQIGLTADDLAAYKRGATATVTITPLAARDQRVDLPMSLNGFTAGFEAASAPQ